MYKEGGENREALLHDQRVDGMTPEFSGVWQHTIMNWIYTAI